MRNAAAVVGHSKPTTKQTVTFWQSLIVAAISITVSILTIGVIYGAMQSRLTAVEEKQKQSEQRMDLDNANVQRRLDKIQDRMVDKDLFNETRQDVKELLKRK